MILGVLPSIIAVAEFVVPKSIPITWPFTFSSLLCHRRNDGAIVGRRADGAFRKLPVVRGSCINQYGQVMRGRFERSGALTARKSLEDSMIKGIEDSRKLEQDRERECAKVVATSESVKAIEFSEEKVFVCGENKVLVR